MRLFRHGLGWFACLVLLGTATASRADAPPDPLRLMPNQADLVVSVPDPGRLAQAFLSLRQFKDLETLQAIQELYDSTNYRRFYQLVAYFEKELGLPWPEVLDRLAGGGAVLGVKFGPDPAPAVVVLQSKDEALLHRFVKLGLEIIEQELARTESKDKIERGTYRDAETVHIGKGFHAAVIGSALLLSNVDEGLKHAIDLQRDGDKKSMRHVKGLAEAGKLLPPGPLASAWANLEVAHTSKQGKEIFEVPNGQPAFTVLFGGWLDVARRAPFICAGLYRTEEGFLTTVRMPSGRAGMPTELAAHLPPTDFPGLLPLLEPHGVLYSSSYFLDVSKLWDHRAKLVNPQQLKGLEDFDKSSGRFLVGNQLSKLLSQVGARQRIVVANQRATGYERTPGIRVPSFAFVLETREPARFAKSIDSILRAAALLATTQVNLKLVEEKYAGCTIVGYRFPDGGEFKADVNEIRFNFSPCFVMVGDQFIACSTLELCRDLIDQVQNEKSLPVVKGKRDTIAGRARAYGSGGADALAAAKDDLIAQTILAQAVPPEKAREQVQALIAWVQRVGTVDIESAYGQNDFRYEIRLKLGR
jgi:hypothetical protein